jgi:DcaP outer membrane protein
MAISVCNTWHRRKFPGKLLTASLFALCVLTGPVTAASQEAMQEQTDLALLLKMLQQQGEELKQQRELLEAQNKKILELQQQIDGKTSTAVAGTGEANAAAIEPLQEALPAAADSAPPVATAEAFGLPTASPQSPDAVIETVSERGDTISFVNYDRSKFAGAFLIPGSETAMRIGGRVKANYVQSFNSVGIQDRFIVGTIPTSNDSQDDKRQSQAALTVQQSRLNFEVRKDTGIEQVRAFIEGDFSGSDDTFKLRHAFGQYRSVLAGKTWTAFMDTEASPEEVDFEGLNSRIIVRQTQLRYFPSIAQDWNLAVSLEDPQPSVSGGTGVSKIPDLVASVRGYVRQRWNVQAALLLRQLSANWEPADVNTPGYGNEDNASGWATSLSGRRFVTWFGDPRDNLMLQINYGKGYGRYVNDLGTIGGQDAVFDDAGNLKSLTVFATYVAMQKWWRHNLRSTFTAGIVDIDNYGFQSVDSYNKTWRTGGNLIWSPTGNINIGSELLWGERTDKNNASGSATQIQAMAQFSF